MNGESAPSRFRLVAAAKAIADDWKIRRYGWCICPCCMVSCVNRWGICRLCYRVAIDPGFVLSRALRHRQGAESARCAKMLALVGYSG